MNYNPIYWWALASLLVPVLIHLYNRRRTRAKVMGSLRWLRPVQPAQASFRRIHQWPLLLVRLVLLTAIVLLLVDWRWLQADKPAARLKTLILIHPEAGDTTQLRQLAAGWQSDSVGVRWLAPNFPETTTPVAAPSGAVLSLVDEADRRFPADSLHVIAPNRADYLAGRLPTTRAAVSWEFTDNEKDTLLLLQAVGNPENPDLLWLRSDSAQTRYAWQRGVSEENAEKLRVEVSPADRSVRVASRGKSYETAIRPPDTLVIRGVNADRKPAWETFQTSVRAVAEFYRVPVRFTEKAQNVHWEVRFGGQNPSPTNSDTVLVWQYAPEGGNGWLEPVAPRVVAIRKPLTAANVLEGGWLEALRPHVLAFMSRSVKTLAPIDYRKTDLPNLPRRAAEASVVGAPPVATDNSQRLWWGLLALGCIALERIWPKKTK